MIHQTARPSPSCDRAPVFRTCFILLLAALAVSCAGLPQLSPVGESSNRDQNSNCRDVFPEGSWRFVHAIETVIAGRPAGVVVGVTVISPGEPAVEAIILSIEGLVMFHARASGDTIDIQRAIAQFDTPEFASRLIEAVSLLFLVPAAVETTSGLSPDENFTCRYIRDDASVVDVMPGSDGGWKILEYDRRAKLRRRVKADPHRDCPSPQGARLPCRLELLDTMQIPAYTLNMSLIEAERITE